MRIRSTDSIKPTPVLRLRFSLEPEPEPEGWAGDWQRLPPERTALMWKGDEPLLGLDGEQTAVIYSLSIAAIGDTGDGPSFSAVSRPASATSSRPSSAASILRAGPQKWGLVKSLVHTEPDMVGVSRDALALEQKIERSGVRKTRSGQPPPRKPQTRQVSSPESTEESEEAVPKRLLSVFGAAAAAGAARPRLLPPIGAPDESQAADEGGEEVIEAPKVKINAAGEEVLKVNSAGDTLVQPKRKKLALVARTEPPSPLVARKRKQVCACFSTSLQPVS